MTRSRHLFSCSGSALIKYCAGSAWAQYGMSSGKEDTDIMLKGSLIHSMAKDLLSLITSKYAEEFDINSYTFDIDNWILHNEGLYNELKSAQGEYNTIPYINSIYDSLFYLVKEYINYLLRFEGSHLVIEETLDMSFIYPELTGTPDAVLYDDIGGIIHVFDFKTGFSRVSAKDNSQLSLYAAGAYKHAKQKIYESFHLRIAQPAINNYDVEVINLKELQNRAISMKKKMQEAANPLAERTAGSHCSKYYCKAVKNCRALYNLTQKILSYVN